MKKRVVCLLLSTVTAFSFATLTFASPEPPDFVDVPANHWAFNAIEQAYFKDVMQGVGNNKFAPDKNVTNAEWIKMISNIFVPENERQTTTGNLWWQPDINWILSSGLLDNTMLYDKINGKNISNISSDVNAPINRYEMAQIIYNISTKNPGYYTYEKTVNTDGISSKISDYKDIPTRYRSAVEYCYASGLLSGVDKFGTFDGTKPMTRAAAAVVVDRLLDERTPFNTRPSIDSNTTVTKIPVETSTPTPTPTPSPTPTPTPEKILTASEASEEVLRLVNIEREKVGANPLTLNSDLVKVAQVKSDDMVQKKYFSHQSPTYGSPFDMMNQFGITYRSAGENIAAGQISPEAVVDSWMHSDGHRKNILSTEYDELGVGYSKGADTEYGVYWVQIFTGK